MKFYTINSHPSQTYTYDASSERPATPEDIADVQQQLAQTCNNPNMILVSGVGCFNSNEEYEEWKRAAAGPAPPPPLTTPRPKTNHGYYPKRIIARHVPGGVKNSKPPTNIFSKPQFYSPMHTPQSQHVPIIVPRFHSFEGTVHGRMEVTE